MEKLGWYEFRVEGLSLERLLNQCTERGVRLSRVKKVSARAVTGRVAAKDLDKLRDLAEARGWRLTYGEPHGAVRLGSMLQRRALLVAGVLAFFVLCGGILSCIWFIDVRGAGPYTGEVERILAEHDVRVGRFGFLIDTDALKTDMERQLTGLSWVGVRANGVRLTVTCVQAQLASERLTNPGDIVAARDGIISEITVTAGTALVKPGDAVRRGQVLVRGEERAWDGAVTPIRAKASVVARVWYMAEAKVSGARMRTVPTGETFTRHTICSPFYELVLDEAPDFADYDLVTDVLPIAGALPVWLRLDRYEAVTREEIARDLEEVQAEAALAASRLVQEKIGLHSRVVDKWVEYSMINDGGCRATAILEALEEIATTSDAILSTN